MNANDPVEPKTIQVGPDRVTLSPRQVIIEAVRLMPDWQVREFKPSPIYFEDRKYRLIAKQPAEKPFAIRYVLEPCPESGLDAGKTFFTYDAESVAERDGGHREGAKTEVASKALLPLYPMLGFLWSGTQRRLEKFGFVSHSITGISVFVGFCLVFLHTVSAVILINSSLRSGKLALGGLIRLMSNSNELSLGPVALPILWLDVVLEVALIVDVAMRYTYLSRDDQWCGGFLEWVFRRNNRVNL